MGRAHRVASRRDVVPTLTTLVRDAASGRSPSTVVVTAGSGTGKSRVVQELVGQSPVPARVVAGGLGSMHEAYGVASRLVGVDLPEPVPADAPERLLAGLDELAARGPQLLVVDDVHRVDAATLALLERVAGSARDLRLALVLTREPTPERAFLSRILRRDDCVELELPPLDALDLDGLVREHLGRWPGPRLRGVLSGASPLEALTVLDDLDAQLVRDGETVEVSERSGHPAAAAAMSERVARLDGRPREAARALAVLGTSASVEDLAALLTTDPVTIVEPLQSLIDDHILAFDEHGRVAFTHEAWLSAVYAAIAPPMRGVLHRAAADRVQPARRPHHLVAAGASADEVLAGLSRATEPLGHAPAVEADLLDEVAGFVEPDVDSAGELAVRRARALARSGQFRRAQEVAQAALPGVRDTTVYSGLMRVLIFSFSTRADLPGVMKVLDETLQLPLPDRVRRVVSEHRASMSILGGLEPVPERPLGPDLESLTLNGVAAEVFRTYLLGELPRSLEYAWEASRRLGTGDVDADEGGSADIWPPIVELADRGPRAARTALREVVRLREERGERWQAAPHQLVEGNIEMLSGNLADAAATLDTGLELAATVEMGWVSQAVGIRALIDVVRGSLAEAEARLDLWEAEDRPLQFGQPQPMLARVLLLEAQRRYDAAAELAGTAWKHAVSNRLRTWMVLAAPELCRVALRSARPDLLASIGDGLRDVRRPPSPAATAPLMLAEALIGDPTRLAGHSAAAAERAQGLGDRYVELLAREEAAVATAVHGDRKDARALAAEALEVASGCGADGVAVRISGRLRAAGVRLGSTAPRSRPTSGWESLTPTEQLVVEQVAAGRTGPEIAQRLNISPRTVQTHVSHVLTKLGLSHRVELAAAAATRLA